MRVIYYEKTPYHLGEIYMYLDPDLKGEVRLTYAESTENNAEVVKVVLDTKKNEIVSAGAVGTDSKLDPGTLDYSGWKVGDAWVVHFINLEKIFIFGV